MSEPRPSASKLPAPSAPAAPTILVTRALTNAFLALKTTQARIREVAVSRLGGKDAHPDEVNEVCQLASTKAVATTSLPGTPEGLRPWVSTLTANTAIDFLRRKGVHEARFGNDVDVDQLPPDALDAPDDEPGDDGDGEEGSPRAPTLDVTWSGKPGEAGAPPPTLHEWLEAAIAKRKGGKASDLAVLEMIRYKANHPGVTDAELAAVLGISPAAYESRFRRFKDRYLTLRQRHLKRRRTMFLLLPLLVLAVAALALLAWLLWPRPLLTIGPEPFVQPAPSATASTSAPERFNQALPPPVDDGKKPK